ncbi:MAG: hypothetical protein AAF620_16140 [Bacteroidota bacterium]
MKNTVILTLLLFSFYLVKAKDDETLTHPEIKVEVLNPDSAANAQLRLKIQNRVSKIRQLNSTFSSYTPVVAPAITTDCFNVKSTVLNVLSTKWKEMLFDKGELEKLDQLVILEPEDQALNDLVTDLRKEFQMIISDTGVDVNTKVSFSSNKIINNTLTSFQSNFYRFERINQICLLILN